MIANNIFKFVSVRAPVLDTGKDVRFVRNDAERTAIARLRQELAKTHDLDRARLLLGSQMMAEPDYYSSVNDWQSLRVSTSEAGTLLQEAAAAPSLKDFENGAESILKNALGIGKLGDFLGSDRFNRLLASLWFSYYATVLNPYPKAQDREEMVVWIEFFTLLDLIDDEPPFDAAAKQVRAMRPAVPIEFYRMTEEGRRQVNPDGPAPPPDPNAARIEQIKKDLAALEAARDYLISLYAEKTGAFRTAAPRRFEREPVRIEEAVRQRPGSKNPATASFGGLRDTPWQVSMDDFAEAEDHLKALLAAGLDPRMKNMPELIHGAEQKIAELEARLAEGVAQPTVTFSGRVLVTSRRS